MRNSRGFTLIELLVVIAIIGLLSSVVLASVQSARNKANIARTIDQVREIEKAFYLIYDSYGCYPLELGADPQINRCPIIINVNNPSLKYIFDNNLIGFKNYFNAAPVFPYGGSQYFYDNDGGSGEPTLCENGNPFDGVGIFVAYDPSTGIAQALEKAFDNTSDAEMDTNKAKNCGRIQYDNAEIDIQFAAYPNL